mmetsp:Transcript_103938/g.323985  ORF Transcript_103938/g.323985 Transcript_103938/m.323985 type:complete len:211 (-) Transcript_103938:169-801(-)
MDYEVGDARAGHFAHKCLQLLPAVTIVYTQAVLHCDCNTVSATACLDHGICNFTYELRLLHETGAIATSRHLGARASHIEVHLVKTCLCTKARGPRHGSWTVPAYLHGHGSVSGFKRQELGERAIPLGIHYGNGRDHLCEEQRTPCQQPCETAKVGIGPLHHRRYREARSLRMEPRGPAWLQGSRRLIGRALLRLAGRQRRRSRSGLLHR